MTRYRDRRNVLEAVRVRDRADAVLRHLLIERDRTERRLADTGRRDPMKVTTGHSALDNAIAATCEMIDHVDEVLARSNGTSNGTAAPTAGFGRRVVQTVQ